VKAATVMVTLPSGDVVDALDVRLCELVASSHTLMRALRAARTLALPAWCIGAGAVRNLVWDHLHGYTAETPAPDIDLVYFDAGQVGRSFEASLAEQLTHLEPGFRWDVVNQAGVHLWLASQGGVQQQPFASLADGIASWPETATCVGVSLQPSGAIEVVAPHGLADLFDMVVRWNPSRVPRAVFEERVASKRFSARWPRVHVLS